MTDRGECPAQRR